jgi:hypothetical protein
MPTPNGNSNGNGTTPDGGTPTGGQNTPAQGQGQPQPQAPQTFDQWIAAQPQDVQAMFNEHVSGLRSALASERTEKKGLSQQIAEMAKKAESGSEAQKQLEGISKQLQDAETRADFAEQAIEQGCTRVKLAFIAAQQDQLIDQRGRINWTQLKETYPELFRASAPAPRGNAGAGAQQGSQGAGMSMDDYIRARAHVK